MNTRNLILCSVGLAVLGGAVALGHAGWQIVGPLNGQEAPHGAALPAAEAEPAPIPLPATFEECVRRAIAVYDAYQFTWETPAIEKGFIMHAEIILCERQFPEAPP